MPRAMDDHKSDNLFPDNNSIEDSSFELSLADLPVEIFLYICSFLDATTLVHRLGLVCKQFYEILRDDSLWKSRIHRVWPNTRYPILPPVEDDENFWKMSCIVVERQVSLWEKIDSMENFLLEDGHFGYVDGLLLMDNGRLCVSGGRDRLLVCWRLGVSESEEKIQMHKATGHDGWIWGLTTLNGKIYSCSWDQRVHEWDCNGSELNLLTRYPMDVAGALLCITSSPELNLLATGSFCRMIFVLDPRMEDPIVSCYQPHKKSVMKVAMNSHYIVSASEDRTVSIWDQRKGQTMKTFELAKDSYPMSMCLQKGAVYLGDNNANIHVLDVNNGFEPVKCYKTEHRQGITGIHVTPGSIITSSLDGTVRISSATDPPRHFVTIQSEYNSIASMDYLNEILAVSVNCVVQIWRPETDGNRC